MGQSKWIKGIPPKMMQDHFGVYQGTWNPELDRCWIRRSDGTVVCSRLLRTDFGNVEHVTLTRSIASKEKGIYDFSWAEKQEIKDELFGENRFAIEVYPKADRLIDVCDVYHLWVFDKKKNMPFGIHPKEYQKAINRGYCVTEEEIREAKEYYDKEGKP